MSATWQVIDKKLVLCRDNYTEIPPAADIYASIIEKVQVWPDVATGMHGGASCLKFSRYPLSLRVNLETSKDGLQVIARLSGAARARTIDISGPVTNDQIVVGDEWFAIDTDSLSEIQAIASVAGSIPGQVHSLRNFLALRHFAGNGGAVVDHTFLGAISPLVFCPPLAGDPKNIEAKLYPYQCDGWRWLRFLAGEQMGGILGDEMGLGKTLQIISMLADSGATTLFPALIVAPGSLLENWRREFNRFAPSLNVLKHHGPDRTGRPGFLSTFDVTVTSYDTIIRDGGLFGMIDWQVLVLDEAQNIRNPDALRTRAVKSLRRKSAFAVTGTPFENRLSDLWSITDLVLPGHLGSREEFDAKYGDDLDSAARVEALVSPVMLRRRIAEVATDLPDRIDIPQVIEFEPSEADAYERIRQDIFERFGTTATLVSLGVLRMFCAHPLLVEDHGSEAASFSKMQRLVEILEEIFASREKALIFTSYTRMADIIAELVIGKFGAFAEVLDGRTSMDDRQPMIDRFSQAKGAGVLVLNPRAGGAGLNITAANHVIHYNLEWNPALEDQASARAFRRGQTKPVTVHRLLVSGTVEEVVDERLRRKRALSSTAVVGVEGKDEDYADIVSALQRSPTRPTDRKRL